MRGTLGPTEPMDRTRGQPAAGVRNPWSLGARWSGADAYLIAGIGAASVLFALWYLPLYRATGVFPPAFYQAQFGPAVMQACGRGFVNPDVTAVPALQAFLDQQVDRFQCEELPETVRVVPLSAFQGTSRYLMAAVALVWRAAGVTWRSLDLLLGALFGVTVAAGYTALRFVSGRSLSVVVTMLWVLSPQHLHNLPHLRDYSKAPFFVLMLLAMAVAFVERRPGRLAALGIVFGAVQGLGFGMRTDVILNFVPFFAILFAGAADGMFRNLKAKLACAGAAVVVFTLVAYPVHRTYAESSSVWHVALLGLSSPYDENLNLNLAGPPYSFPYAFNDTYIEAVVKSYWSRIHPAAAPIALLTPRYDEACQDYFATLATTFPGDMVTRMLASAVRIFDLPFLLEEGHVPRGVTSPPLVWLSEWRWSLMQALRGFGLLALAGVLMLIGMEGLRYACVAFILMFMWATYPFIEFQGRHIFQFELLVLAVIALGCSLSMRFVRAIASRGLRRETISQAMKSVATVGALFAVVGVTLVVARWVQAPRAQALLTSYATARADPLQSTLIPLPDGQVRVAVDVFGASSDGDEVQEAMLEAEFAPDRCGASSSSMVATFRYEEMDPRFSLQSSRETRVPLVAGAVGPTRVFLPVYSVYRRGKAVSRFVGIEIPGDKAPCIQLSRVADLSRLPLWLPALLTPDWSIRKLYQRMHFDAAMPPSVWLELYHRWPGLSEIG